MKGELGKLTISVKALMETLNVVVPKLRKNQRAKPYPVQFEYRNWSGTIRIYEFKKGLVGGDVAAKGALPEIVQINGRPLRSFVERCDPDGEIDLVAFDDVVCLSIGSSRMQISRFDAPGKKKKKRPDPYAAHSPVEVPPDPKEKRVELADTWAFSARVPVPQHRKKSDPQES